MKFEPFHVSYISRKGKVVNCLVTLHAQIQFLQRFEKLYMQPPGQDISADPKLFRAILKEKWKSTNRLKNLNKEEQRRVKAYPGESLYFRTSGFTFVVANAHVISVEISDKDKRHLNKERQVI